MIKALLNLFKRDDIVNTPSYSFSIVRYSDENEIYEDVKSIDINVGVSKYSRDSILSAISPFLKEKPKTKKFLEFFLEKLLEKLKVVESVMYLHIDNKVIRVKNNTVSNPTIIRIIINK
jgi:glycine cleavage system H lipoate-binding protein